MYETTHQAAGFALLLSLLFALILAAGAQGSCHFLRGDEKGSTYLLLEGTYDSGATTSYSDANCENEYGPWVWGDGGAAFAETEEEARAICQSNAGGSYNVALRIQDGGNLWGCGESRVSSRTSGGRRSGGSGSSHSIVPTPKLVVYTGEVLQQLGEHISAVDGMRSGIQFQRPTRAGIGIQWIIDEGVIDAMDVWGNAGRGYEVCFAQAGRWIFLDAAFSPRKASWEAGYRRDGLSCIFMDRVGTVVLVSPGEEPVETEPTPAPIPTIDPATWDDIADAVALDDCTVSPRIDVNLRQEPWGQILDEIPANTEVAAAARTENWFRVMHGETEGWAAAWLMDMEGDCD